MKLQYLNICMICIVLISSCTYKDFSVEEWGLQPELSFSKNGVLFNSAISTDTINVFTNYESFVVNSSENWCSVTVDNIKSAIQIIVEPNFDTQPRTAILTVSIARGNQALSKTISVVQMGGIWETIGNFNVYWAYEISETQREAIVSLLNSMVYVEGGGFIMGATTENIVDAATPHPVRLSPFYISKFETTQIQWNAVMGNNPSNFIAPNHPVENISWYDALDFVTRLSKLTNLKVSIPTEAQWEYAARGGEDSKGYIYPGSNDYNLVAVTTLEGLNAHTSPVGSLVANELGLYDMAGNVSEFCSDWHEMNYVNSENTDPTGPLTGTFKCLRGGCVIDSSYKFRSINRFQWASPKDTGLMGLRIVIKQ